MALCQVSLTDFRNIGQSRIELHPEINLFCGPNGAGKTSILEAIFVLSRAQSFRTSQLKQCIRHGNESFVLFGAFEDYRAGLSRDQKNLSIQVDGMPVKRRSELAKKSPVNVVNTETLSLIEGPPEKRRNFLDWCLFHVEPTYIDNWVAYQHALKQRNRLLKARQDLALLDYWDRHLAESAGPIHVLRERYTAKLDRLIKNDLNRLIEDLPVELHYSPGWVEGASLLESLQRDRDRDQRAGYTHSGIHRSDLMFRIEGRSAGTLLSRGQSKRFCLGLMLAALKLVGENGGGNVSLLIDDLNSELDVASQAMVYRELEGLDLQLFISSIDTTLPASLKEKDFKMFHLENGIIKAKGFS